MNAAIGRSGWWRRQGPWLSGALVLAAWALCAPYVQWRENVERTHPTRAINVAQGQWARYEGARWRLTDVEVEPLKQHGRPDAVALVARFEVIPDPATAANLLDRCKVRATDAAGRVWDADDTRQFGVYAAMPTKCGSGMDAHFDRTEAKPGQVWAFAKVFAVPRAVPPEQFRPEIVMLWPRSSPVGSYLHFVPAH